MCKEGKKGIRKVCFPLYPGDLSVFYKSTPSSYYLKEYLKSIQVDNMGYIQFILETDGLKYIFLNKEKSILNSLLYELDYRETIRSINRLEEFKDEELNTKTKISKLSLYLKEIDFDEQYPVDEIIANLDTGKLCVIQTDKNYYVIVPQTNYVGRLY